ncbi:MAG: hypothetical protein ABGY96_07470 [bacterium]
MNCMKDVGSKTKFLAMITIELHYNGQIDADSMQGKIDTPRGAIPFTGKRTK